MTAYFVQIMQGDESLIEVTVAAPTPLRAVKKANCRRILEQARKDAWIRVTPPGGQAIEFRDIAPTSDRSYSHTLRR